MTDLFLHDSAARTKRRFEPIDPGHVRIYVCGPTVYDLAHLGNARPVVVFDVLARLLRRVYPRVTYVRNITDVEDKINERARESGEPIAAITARTTADFHRDMAAREQDVGRTDEGGRDQQVHDEFGLPDGRLVEHRPHEHHLAHHRDRDQDHARSRHA